MSFSPGKCGEAGGGSNRDDSRPRILMLGDSVDRTILHDVCHAAEGLDTEKVLLNTVHLLGVSSSSNTVLSTYLCQRSALSVLETITAFHVIDHCRDDNACICR